MEVSIKDVNQDGRGRGAAGSRTALISQALPGETVVVRIDRETRGTVQGRIAQLLTPSSLRVPSPCSHQDQCTGCPFLPATRAGELQLKLLTLRQLLQRGYGFPEPEPFVSDGRLYGYRHLVKHVFAEQGGRCVLGSYVQGTHEVVDNAECPVLVEGLTRLMDTLASAVTQRRLSVHGQHRRGLRHAIARESRATGRRLLVLATSDPHSIGDLESLAEGLLTCDPGLSGVSLRQATDPGNVLLAGKEVARRGHPFVVDRLLGYEHQIGPESFFQINPAMAERLFQVALDIAGTGDVVVETHSGVGALTLPLAERFLNVTAIEVVPQSVAQLREGVTRSGFESRVRVVEGAVEDRLDQVLTVTRSPLLVADPPRAGLGKTIAAILAKHRVRRLVLLSCSAESLARDAGHLKACGYVPVRWIPVDMFPRTAHQELVTEFVGTAREA